eukprot:NODE_872_length_3542_cov_0.462968.p1 type:complete len:407 gc:universal NODE_872_length_3542_cov_0.462968:3143-1923(-)
MKNTKLSPGQFFSDPGNLHLYSDEIQFICTPTGSGAANRQELQFFFKVTQFATDWAGLKNSSDLSYNDLNGTIVRESTYTFHIKESEPNAFQWLIPGMRLSTPGDVVSISLPIVVIINYSNLIDSVRIYWDQASVLTQIGYLYNVNPKPHTFITAPQFSLPVLGSVQSSKLVTFESMNPFIHNLLSAQSPAKQVKHNDSMQSYLDDSNIQPIFSDINDSISQHRQLKQSPFKSKDSVKEHFDGKSEQDWLPKTKLMHETSKSTVFDDLPAPQFSHIQINPNKNRSQFEMSAPMESANGIVKRGQGNTSHVFDADSEFLPARKGIKRAGASGISQIQFGSEESLKQTKNQSQINFEHHDLNSPSQSNRRMKKASHNNTHTESHFSISDSGRMDPKKEYHGRGKVFNN